MKFTELSDYPLDGGIVTEWIPTAVLSPSEWQLDTRPLSYEHEAILCASDPPPQPSWLGAAFTIPHRYDPVALDRAIRAWLSRHDAFHTIGDRTAIDDAAPGGVIRRTYREARIGVRREVAGHVPDGADLARRPAETFDDTLCAHTWPHVRVVSITPMSAVDVDEHFTVVFAADHLVMDAYSIMLSINEIQQFYRGFLFNDEVELYPVGSHIEFSSLDRATGGAVTPDHPTVRAWDGFTDLPPLAACDSRATTELGPPDSLPPDDHAVMDGAGGRQLGYSEFIVDGAQCASLNARAREAGMSTQAAVFAAIALASGHVCGEPDVRMIMPWHTRHEHRFLASVGWYVGLAPLRIDLHAATTFAQACSIAAASLDTARTHSRVPHRRVHELLGSSVTPSFVVSYLDLRRVPGAADWPSQRAQALRSSAYSDREVYLWIGRVDDGLTLSARYPATDAGVLVVDFVGLVAHILRTAASDGLDVAVDHLLSHDTTTTAATRTA